MMKFLTTLVIFSALFYLFVRYLEQTSIFLPGKEISYKPDQVGLVYDDIFFKTEDGIFLNGWFVGNTRSRSVLLFFHGNAGNIGDRIEKISLFHRMGLNVFIVDYRGYGKSQGKPSEEGMYQDARAAYDYLLTRDDIDPKAIIVYGVSLGGAAAVDLVSERDVKCLIVDSAFPSAKDMAKIVYPFIPSFLIQTKLDSESKISSATIPKLFIHSRDDETVPLDLAEKLYLAAPRPKEFLEIEGGHNDGYIVSGSEFSSGVKKFLKKHNAL